MKAMSSAEIRRLKRSPKLAVSDKELKNILEQEYINNPELFIPSDSESTIETSQEFLRVSSARVIEPMKKWL